MAGYGRFVGRVGALAVAVGIGTVLLEGCPVALASPDSASDAGNAGTTSASDAGNAGTTSASNAGNAGTTGANDPAKPRLNLPQAAHDVQQHLRERAAEVKKTLDGRAGLKPPATSSDDAGLTPAGHQFRRRRAQPAGHQF